MAHRRIGQERLGFGREQANPASPLDEMWKLIAWTEVARTLGDIYTAAKGEHGWPPLALFKALLLATWYDLSDVKLAEAVADRASFRRFCGFSATEPIPERTAFVRFRAELVPSQPGSVAIRDGDPARLKTKGVAVRTGTLVDATLIPSASIRHDHEARWAGHRRACPPG